MTVTCGRGGRDSGGVMVFVVVTVVVAVVAASGGVVQGDDCTDVASCNTIHEGCGWCWYATTTRNQRHGARPGTAHGPHQGSCSDWTYNPKECHHHVDCPSLPDCENILGTYCGWCESSKTAMKGNKTGPFHGSCKKWIWNHLACPSTEGPEQIHLSYTENSDEMAVTWASKKRGFSSVTWTPAFPGPGPSWSSSAEARTTFFDGIFNSKGTHFIHRAIMSDLVPGQYYNYTVTTGSHDSQSFTFRAMPNSTNSNFLVFGDMGRHGGGMVLQMLQDEIRHEKTRWDGLLHFGDFAYDLASDGGVNGDTFMNRIQSLAATHPYMTCVGNHEIEAGTFANYLHRFTMPHHGSAHMMWHSWNIGLVHFISYSSEVFFANVWDIDNQRKWLEADLKEANLPHNRTQRPWIIAYGHRPFYCSNRDHDDCTKNSSIVRAGLEDLFHKYGVDVIFEAHEHSYERLWPTYNNTATQFNYKNPKAAVHFVTGAAGCNENDGACINPISGPRLPWSAFRSSAEGTYSYGHLKVLNTTHLYFDSYVAEEERVEDAVYIIQHHHGMRA